MIKSIHHWRRWVTRTLSVMMAVCLLSIGAVHAQDEFNPDDAGDGGELGGETSVPFDGGVSMLVIGTVCYGMKKTYDAKIKVEDAGGEEMRR